jgi:hypothetical protein
MTNANIGALAFNQQALISPQINGGTLGFSLGTVSTQVLPINPQRQKVTFHNPGTIVIYVCQALDSNGGALVAGANPGNWQIFPGGLLIFTGNGAGGAWLAAAASASGNPFTVAESQTP